MYRAGEHPTLCLYLKSPLPETWVVKTESGETVASNKSWTAAAGSPLELDWSKQPVPFMLEVHWESKTTEGVASWPVNVENPSTLLPPEALRDLRLEEFLEVLSSTRPLHKAVAAVIRKRMNTCQKKVELDPLKRVNTEEFLLRRTQRFALALERMRERLERPVLTQDAFQWRIHGPLGAKALAEACLREAKQPAEAAFFLAELSLMLGRVDSTKPAMGGLSEIKIQTALDQCIDDLKTHMEELQSSEVPEDIWNYALEALMEAVK